MTKNIKLVLALLGFLAIIVLMSAGLTTIWTFLGFTGLFPILINMVCGGLTGYFYAGEVVIPILEGDL